jgi:hypothetical protein
MLTMKKPIAFVVGVLAVAAIGGCASSGTTKTVKKTNSSTTDVSNQEYSEYTSLGSRIPRKVKKSDAAPSDAESKATQETFREIRDHGNVPPTNVN